MINSFFVQSDVNMQMHCIFLPDYKEDHGLKAMIDTPPQTSLEHQIIHDSLLLEVFHNCEVLLGLNIDGQKFDWVCN
jgi:hypothetical protein